MPWIITKEWRGEPLIAQLADRRVYPTRETAEEQLEELYREFPGRVFRVRKQPLQSEPEFRKPGENTPNSA